MKAYWEPLDDALMSVIEVVTDPAEALEVAYVVIVTELVEIRGDNSDGGN
jgi:hypothetical protein